MMDKETQIIANLDDSLLKPEYIGKGHKLHGHCYVAAEAYYHLWGKVDGYFPVRAKDGHGVTHWWLQHKDGTIVDPTSAQYRMVGEVPPYNKGIKGGFLTKEPSKRTQILMDRILR